MTILFRLYAVFFLATAAYHVIGLFNPEWMEPSPVWRHGLFIAINLVLAVGVLKKPRFFISFVVLLTVQQVISHGTRAITIWNTRGDVDWSSILVTVGMPTLVAALLADRCRNR